MPVFNSTNPLKFNPTTPIQIYIKSVEYVRNKGNVSVWIRQETDGYDTYYSEWRTIFGDRAIAAESLGVKEGANIKTYFNPVLYEAMRRNETLIVKNLDESAFAEGKPDKDNPNLYELWGGIDNILEENLFMEFRVRRYEGL